MTLEERQRALRGGLDLPLPLSELGQNVHEHVRDGDATGGRQPATTRHAPEEAQGPGEQVDRG